MNSLHSSSIALNLPMATSSSSGPAASGPASTTNSSIATASASLVNNVHSPKSPCQPLSVHHSLSQSAHQQPLSLSNVTPASNLMSTSLNSSQLQSHTTGASLGASGTSLSIHPSGMSTSLHSGGGSGNIAGGAFDNNGTAWNSTSSLSPTSSSAYHRKMEVKLNAMP